MISRAAFSFGEVLFKLLNVRPQILVSGFELAASIAHGSDFRAQLCAQRFKLLLARRHAWAAFAAGGGIVRMAKRFVIELLLLIREAVTLDWRLKVLRWRPHAIAGVQGGRGLRCCIAVMGDGGNVSTRMMDAPLSAALHAVTTAVAARKFCAVADAEDAILEPCLVCLAVC